MRPLFSICKIDQGKIPFLPLAELPTPLRRLNHLSDRFDCSIWLKDDGVTHPDYGGNKIRKFEFVLADALKKKSELLLTGGAIGSNQVVALGVFARNLGLKVCSLYCCQPLTEHVRKNINTIGYLPIDPVLVGSYTGMAASFPFVYLKQWLKFGHRPYLVPPGASSPLGVLGYCNAAIELAEQLAELNIDPPERIYVAVGSCGTFTGLLLAKWLFGHPWEVIGVRIIAKSIANVQAIRRLALRAYELLKKSANSIPPLRIGPIPIEDRFAGITYGQTTPEACQAIDLSSELEDLALEPTYTGKTMAALLSDATTGNYQRLLFWNTLSKVQPTFPELLRRTTSLDRFLTQEPLTCCCPRLFVRNEACPHRQGPKEIYPK